MWHNPCKYEILLKAFYFIGYSNLHFEKAFYKNEAFQEEEF